MDFAILRPSRRTSPTCSEARANGVTTVRFMIGTPELLSLRSRSASGEIDAPTIFVATKVDKLSRREVAARVAALAERVGADVEQIIPFSQVEAFQAATADNAKRTTTVTIPNADHGYGFYSDQPDVDAALHAALVQFFRKALH